MNGDFNIKKFKKNKGSRWCYCSAKQCQSNAVNKSTKVQPEQDPNRNYFSLVAGTREAALVKVLQNVVVKFLLKN